MKVSIEIILSLIQTIALTIGVLLTIRQVILLRKQISLTTEQLNIQLDWQRKQVTFDYIGKYTNEFQDNISFLQERVDILKENSKKDDHYKLHLDDDNLLRTNLYTVVSFFEQLAIGINAEYFDENIVRSALNNVVITNYYLIKPYLEIRRNETKKSIGKHFEDLAMRWENNDMKT